LENKNEHKGNEMKRGYISNHQGVEKRLEKTRGKRKREEQQPFQGPAKKDIF
jgi:hypothetical protein